MACLSVEIIKGTPVIKEERVHGGLLLLNELLRVSDVKFEVIIFHSKSRTLTNSKLTRFFLSIIDRLSARILFIRIMHPNQNQFPTKLVIFNTFIIAEYSLFFYEHNHCRMFIVHGSL